MPARSPAETSALFTAAVNAQDLEAVIALYEADAISLPPTGDDPVSENQGRRDLFTAMFTLQPAIDLQVTRTLQSGELAMVTGSWTLEGKDPEGNPISMSGHYADVVRRQPDGTWLFVIDNPLPAA